MTAWTYEYAYPIPAPPARVFKALTDARELEAWFAEHAEVELTAGGAYRFWGRHTVGAPTEGESSGSLTRYEPDSGLAFEWEMLGAPSTVHIRLEPQETEMGPCTNVSVKHEFSNLFDGPRPQELVDDWWRYSLGNLMMHAMDRDVMRPDFDDPGPDIRMTMEVEAPPEKVFRALTEPEALNQWMAQNASVELRVGGRFDLGWPAPEGFTGDPMRILELVENERLKISWPDWRGDDAVPDQTVTWNLAPTGSGTRVTLVHSGFVRAVDWSDYPFGWGHFLSQMKGVAESL